MVDDDFRKKFGPIIVGLKRSTPYRISIFEAAIH